MKKDKTTKRLTERQYVNKAGGTCPVCHGTDITGVSGADVDGCEAWMEIQCNDCDSSWHDIYKLCGYSMIESTR